MIDLRTLFSYPIIQGPMAGGATTPALVAAVSNAGALGSLAGSLLGPAALRRDIAAIRALTDQPFLVNFFVQDVPTPDAAQLAHAVALLQPITVALGLATLPMPAQWCEPFGAQLDTIVELRPPIVSFTFDQLDAARVARLHAAGIVVIGTVTTVDEALAWQAAGADAVVASGVESGGHRGTFLGAQEAATLGTFALLPAVVAAVQMPVIAAGGIMDGADIAHALALGAQAVQMGTAFLVTDEAGIHPAYRQCLLEARVTHPATRLTRAFSGRYARGIVNTFMDTLAAVESQMPPYPIQNALTGALRAEAARRGDPQWMSLWCGTGVERARPMPAGELVKTLVAEAGL